ncbi:histidinol-phosphate transaminase [Granulicella sp. dw_53]|uniref:pyridoxal phosphate-dependent aminotransferase n=1 Tax=Granulicella sp. dw_53 TaxID=2719792 RepID=UPI001BD5EE41|nr:histidinol-phosphate transaminase [Granulicella sp. dw_53]
MSIDLSRRTLLKSSGAVLGASVIASRSAFASGGPLYQQASPERTIRLSFNENPYGPSPQVAAAVQRELTRLNRYADNAAGKHLAEEIAAYERVPVEQVVLGEILGFLGLYLGSQGGPGGEFLYSTPGYLALIDAAARVGGVGVPVPLNAQYCNDLPALKAKLTERTRAIYLVNPHNPTGTVNDDKDFKRFLLESSQHAVAIVDEAYLEYTPDFASRSAVSLVRDGANVMVFRTFDKIHALAGMPIGYVLAPRALADALRKQGAGDAESLGRMNIVAASAALRDTAQVERTRKTVAHERETWLSVLRDLKLEHTQTSANFVFFNAGQPQPKLAAAMLAQGVDIGRAHPPYTNWARITIGLPEENRRAQAALKSSLGG